MTTANLSVGINTEKARADLNALKDFMRGQLSSMALSINAESLTASVNKAMKGPGGNGYSLKINAAQLKTDISDALNNAAAGAKVDAGSLDLTKINAGVKLITQNLATAAADAQVGERITKEIKDSTPAAVKAAGDAGKAAGNAFVKGEADALVKREQAALQSNTNKLLQERAAAAKVAAEAEARLAEAVRQNAVASQAAYQSNTNKLLQERAAAAKVAAEAEARLAEAVRQNAVASQAAYQSNTNKLLQERAAAAKVAAEAEDRLAEATRRRLAADLSAVQANAAKIKGERDAREQAYAASLANTARAEANRKPSGITYNPLTMSPMVETPAAAPTTASTVAATVAATTATKRLGDAVKQVGQAHTEATGKTKAHTAAMHDAHSAARGLASGMGMMWLTWGNIAPLLAGASLSHGFIQAMKAGSEFAYQLTFVKAVSGETAEAVKEIGQAALTLGKDSLYGPVEIANGLRILSQAGLSATEAISALPTVLNLATAGEMEMKDAALTLVGVMSAFGLHTRDLEHIGNVFAKAAAVSQTNVEQMTQAMKTASVVGEQYGASIEDTATALTLLAKVNITGTAAGTSFRNMLKELYAPTDKAKDVLDRLKISAESSTGSLRPFADIVYELKGKIEQFDKGSQVNILQRLFGERGAKEAIAMLSLTRKQWDELNGTISNSSGFLRDVSQQLEATTKGTLKQALNTLQVSMVEAFNASEGAAGKLAVQLKELFGSAAFKDTLMGLVSGAVSLTNALVQMAPVLATVAGGWVLLKGAMLTNELLLAVEAGVLRLNAALLAKGAAAAAASSSMLVVTNTATSLAPAVAGATAATAGLATGMSAFLIPLAAVVAAAGGLYLAYNKLAQSPDAEKLASDSMALASVMRNLRKETDQATAAILRQENAKANKRETVTVDTAINAQIAAINAMKAKVEDLRDVASTSGGLTAARAALQIHTLTNEIEASEERLKDGVIERFRLQGQEASNIGRSYNLMLSDVQEKISGVETSIFQARKAATTPAEKSRINEQEAALNRIQDRLNSLKANASGITKGATTEVVRTLQNDLEKLVNEASMASGHMKMEFGKATKGAADSLGKTVQTEFNALKNASNAKVQLVKDEMQMRVRTEESGWEEIKKIYAEAAEEQAALLASRFASAKKPEEKAKIIKEIQDVAEAYVKGVSEVAKAFKKLDDEELKATQDYTKSLGATAEELLKKAKASEEENAQIGMSAQQLEKLAQKRYEEALQIKNAEADRLSSLVSQEQEVAIKEQAALVQALYNAGLSEEAAAAASSIPAQTEKEGLYKAQLFLIEQQISAMSRLQAADMARPKLKAQADEWKKFTDDIERSLTDSLYRAFEAGDDFGEAFAKSLQNTFKTMVLKVAVQAVVQPVSEGLQSLVGGSSSSSGGGSSLSSLGNLSSLLNIGSGVGASAASLAAANLSGAVGGDAIGTLIAGNAVPWGVEAGAVGGMSGALGTIAAAAPYVAAVAGIAMIAMKAFKSGGPKSEGDVFASLTDTGISGLANYSAVGGKGFTSDTADAAAAAMVVPLSESIISMAKKYGGSAANLNVGLGYSNDPLGSSPDQIFGSVMNTATGVGYAHGYEAERNTFQTEVGTESKRVMLAALQQSGLEDWANEIVQSVNAASATGPQIDEIFAKLENTAGVVEATKALEDLGGGAIKLTQDMITAMGGLDAARASLAAYYDLYFTAEEKTNKLRNDVTASLAAVGVAMPQSKEQFRAIVESLDLTTSAGQATFAAMMNVGPAFAQLADGMDAAATEAAAALERIVAERQSWQNKLDVLTGATTERQLSLQADLASTTDATTQALIRQVYAQEDLNTATAEAARIASGIASERSGLETQLLQVQGNTTELRQRELDALDPSNRALQEQIWTLQDLKAAAEIASQVEKDRQDDLKRQAEEEKQRIAAIASERDGLQRQLWQAQGNTVALRAAELAALDASNRALQEQIWVLEDQAAAAQKLAQIESERMGLQKQLWQLQGNTAAIRKAELSALDESNRGLQLQIWALEDSKKAADEWKNTWESLSNSLLDQARKLRGEISKQSSASLLAQFATTTAQARAGDATAAGQLVSLSDQVMEAYTNTAGTSLEVARMAASLANSLEVTAGTGTLLAPQNYRGTVDSKGSPVVANPQATTEEIRQLREENRVQAAAIAKLLADLARITNRWDRDGMPSARVEAV